MGLKWGKLFVTIERRPCFFRRKNNQSAIFTARRKNSHCVLYIGTGFIIYVHIDSYAV